MSRKDGRVDIYGGKDPLDVPAYSLAEAAHIIQVPKATVRAWAIGYYYGSSRRENGNSSAAEVVAEQLIEPVSPKRPIIKIADRKTPATSFRNIIELHVLAAIRRKHRVTMPAVRKAIAYTERTLGIKHLFADQEMATDGKHLFIERYGKLVNISSEGQLEMKSLVEVYLQRIERSKIGLPIRMYPFSIDVRAEQEGIEEAPRVVVIDPRVQFGKPCIIGTGVPTDVIADRYKAGEQVEALASDYGQKPEAISEAIRYELIARAAA